MSVRPFPCTACFLLFDLLFLPRVRVVHFDEKEPKTATRRETSSSVYIIKIKYQKLRRAFIHSNSIPKR